MVRAAARALALALSVLGGCPEPAIAEPVRSEACVLGLDLNGNGIVDIGDYGLVLRLLLRTWGEPVVNCPPLPAPHVWCDPANAYGIFCCEPFDPDRHVAPWLDAKGRPLPVDLQKPAACLPGEPLGVGEIPPSP